MPWFALALVNPSYPLSKVSCGRVHWLCRLRLLPPVRATLAGSFSFFCICMLCNTTGPLCMQWAAPHPRIPSAPETRLRACVLHCTSMELSSTKPNFFLLREMERERSLVPLAGCTTSGSCLRWPCMTCRIILEEGKAVFARPQRDLLLSRRHRVRKSTGGRGEK